MAPLVNEQYIVDENGKPTAVILPIKEYKKMLFYWIGFRIANEYDLSVDWLLTGEGPMLKGDRSIEIQLPDTENPEMLELLSMTKHILESKTEYSNSLSANIRSFYRSIEMDERLSRIENALNEEKQTTQQRLSDIESKFKEHKEKNHKRGKVA